MTSPERRVLIVDDSRTIRALLRAAIDADERLNVVGEAADPYEAREKIKCLDPDVLTLDVEMPKMNGLDFLRKIMRLRPMPVVMVSTRTRENSEDAIRALSIGAVECVDAARLQADPIQRSKLLDTLYLAASAQVQTSHLASRPSDRSPQTPAFRWNGTKVLIGSSTGGVDAIERVLAHFPKDAPPTLIAQHMPQSFLASFAARLNENYEPTVRLATDWDELRQGEVLLAPGGTQHATLDPRDHARVRLVPSDASDTYVPSVDRLFGSGIVHAKRCLGVVLTGMGSDGAKPLTELRKGGSMTFAQTGDTCIVDGMPRAARDAGGVVEQVPLEEMGPRILKQCSKEAVQ